MVSILANTASMVIGIFAFCSLVAETHWSLENLLSLNAALSGVYLDERRVRYCSRYAAAQTNLRMAEAFLRQANDKESRVPIDRDGEVVCSGGNGLAAFLYREHNPRLPVNWPNWVTRLYKL